jgi:4-amino-4-deoxy-L-arabinose transferase-like glycosyltransferase
LNPWREGPIKVKRTHCDLWSFLAQNGKVLDANPMATPVLPPKAGPWQRARASDVGRVLAMWVGIRTAIWLWMLGTAWLSGVDAGRRVNDPVGWVVDRLIKWDSDYFVGIAQHGYNSTGATCCDQAFFPGYPLTIRALTPLFGDARIAALALPLVAGAVAAMLLWRITVDEFGSSAGRHAVALLALAPYGIFLSLAYSESLFLAFALAAWYSARHQHWWWAGVAASAAALVRVNGVFVAVGLGVMWLTSLRRDRDTPRSAVLALLLPFASAGAYLWYVQSRNWPSWTQAQSSAWDRRVGWPWDGFAWSWRWLTAQPSVDLRIAGLVEPLLVLAGAALVVLLARRRRWDEFVYVALSVGVLLFSNRFLSSPRLSVLWFPAFVLGGSWLARNGHRRWSIWVYAVSILGLAVTSLAFAAHMWVS